MNISIATGEHLYISKCFEDTRSSFARVFVNVRVQHTAHARAFGWCSGRSTMVGPYLCEMTNYSWYVIANAFDSRSPTAARTLCERSHWSNTATDAPGRCLAAPLCRAENLNTLETRAPGFIGRYHLIASEVDCSPTACHIYKNVSLSK